EGEGEGAGDGHGRVDAAVDEVDLRLAVDAVGGGGLGVDLDDTAVEAAEAHRESARVEVDAVEELGVQDRGPAEEVVKERDRVPVDEDAAVVRVGAADEEEPGAERRAREARQALEDGQRMAERARHRRELALLEGGARGLELLALALDDGLVGISARRSEVDDDLAAFGFAERHRLDEAVVTGAQRDDVVGAGGQAVEAKRALLVGLGLGAGLAQRDGGADEEPARPALLHRSGEDRLAGGGGGL